jgi:hypothetical protein
MCELLHTHRAARAVYRCSRSENGPSRSIRHSQPNGRETMFRTKAIVLAFGLAALATPTVSQGAPPGGVSGQVTVTNPDTSPVPTTVLNPAASPVPTNPVQIPYQETQSTGESVSYSLPDSLHYRQIQSASCIVSAANGTSSPAPGHWVGLSIQPKNFPPNSSSNVLFSFQLSPVTGSNPSAYISNTSLNAFVHSDDNFGGPLLSLLGPVTGDLLSCTLSGFDIPIQ